MYFYKHYVVMVQHYISLLVSGTGFAITLCMECYFGSLGLPEENEANKSALVTFHIPALGIKFKAPFNAVDDNHGNFASLLALLEFIDTNQKYFSNHTYEIFGNNLKVVNQVNKLENIPPGYDHLLEKALKYKDKYRFSLTWIPTKDNLALDSLFE